MENVNSAVRRLLVSGSSLIVLAISCMLLTMSCFAEDVKQPNVAGAFYPDNPVVLSEMIDKCLQDANPQTLEGEIFALISPHAGYDFSGSVAAYGYKLIKNKGYKTVVIIGPSHYSGF